MKTYSAKPLEVERKWYLIDAEGEILGRLAARVANILRGKNKPEYTPNVDTGDFVIVINADKVLVSGKKETDKIYYHHTGFPGGLKSASVKELREKTGAGMMDCKKALSATDGDMDKAIDFLREKGLASAAKKAGRVAAEGVVTSYIHAGGRIGVLVEVNCETDFVAGTPEFQDFARDIAMQIAAANPTCVRREEVDPAAIEHERQVLREQAINEGKPEKIVERMVEGRLEKYYKEVCLLDQPYIKDPDVTISDLVKGKIAKIGENISIRRFVRYQLGEGIEKKADNFVEEVMAAVK